MVVEFPVLSFHDKTIHVTNCGRICPHRKKINLSTVFAGQAVGIKEVEARVHRLAEKTLQPLDNPFGQKCNLCVR
jgi:hypothetical protein